MGNWGAEHFSNNATKSSADPQQRLTDLVTEFPSKLKQAMFAAASHGNIRRGTWNGCAFNAAGNEVQHSVMSTGTAAAAFGITERQAQIFIRNWDALEGSDEDCTFFLREAIERAGLFLEPGERHPRIVRIKVYENQQKKLREQFDTLMEANLVPDTDMAEFLLTGTSA